MHRWILFASAIRSAIKGLMALIALPIFAYVLTIAAAYLAAAQVSALTQVVILSIPISIILIVGSLYLLIIATRAILIAVSGQGESQGSNLHISQKWDNRKGQVFILDGF